MLREIGTPDIGSVKNLHPCFSGGTHMNKGRIHLPVSPACNIQCKFCERRFNKTDQRPGVASELLPPENAVAIVTKALTICPEITVVGIAGPGDTLATPHALETFRLIHSQFPELINCMSTNGLLLGLYADDLWDAGVRTVTVTVNAVDPTVLQDICSHIVLDGVVYKGIEGAEKLIAAQRRGIEKMSALGAIVKVNTVLIPRINGLHIADIARAVKSWGASIMNIIPLIPLHELAGEQTPSCAELNDARVAAEEYLPVFRHCQHCRADACGIPGKSDLSDLLYENSTAELTFSHG